MIHQISINQTTTKEELYNNIHSLVKAYDETRNPELEEVDNEQSFIIAMYQTEKKSDTAKCLMMRMCKQSDCLEFSEYLKQHIFASPRK